MQNIEIKKLPSSEVEIVGELPTPEFTKFRGAALSHLNEHAKIDGFRAGKVPENVLVNNVGEDRVLLEMAELALQELYPKIVAEEKIDAIGRPEITITKLAKDNPLGFKIKTAIAPEVKLPDYQSIAKEINAKPVEEVKVEDKEVDDVLAEAKKHNEKLEVNDELKTRVRENMQKEKEFKARDKKRLSIMEGIIAKSEIVLPPVLVESELDRMFAELKSDIERIGLKFDDYLKHLKKTEEDLRATWRADAEKRVKVSLILDEIATKEKLAAKEEDVEAEVKHLQNHYPDVPPERIKSHVGALLRNEEVWKFLEGVK